MNKSNAKNYEAVEGKVNVCFVAFDSRPMRPSSVAYHINALCLYTYYDGRSYYRKIIW